MKKGKLTPYLLLVPVVGLLILVYAYPLVSAIKLCFYELYLIHSMTPKFIGLRNFSRLWDDEVFRLSMKNSIYWVGGSNLCNIAIAMGFALLANVKFRFRGVVRGTFILPWVIPVVVVGILWRWIYNTEWGLLNGALLSGRILSSRVSWLSNSRTMWPSIILANSWKTYGFMFVCFLSGLQSIPLEVYEAATIDGASKWKTFLYITLPLLKPVATVVILLGIVWTFNDFNMVYLLTKGGPGHASMVYGPFVYMQSFWFYHFGYAAAAGVVGFLMMIIFGIIYLTQTKID